MCMYIYVYVCIACLYIDLSTGKMYKKYHPISNE